MITAAEKRTHTAPKFIAAISRESAITKRFGNRPKASKDFSHPS